MSISPDIYPSLRHLAYLPRPWWGRVRPLIVAALVGCLLWSQAGPYFFPEWGPGGITAEATMQAGYKMILGVCALLFVGSYCCGLVILWGRDNTKLGGVLPPRVPTARWKRTVASDSTSEQSWLVARHRFALVVGYGLGVLLLHASFMTLGETTTPHVARAVFVAVGFGVLLVAVLAVWGAVRRDISTYERRLRSTCSGVTVADEESSAHLQGTLLRQGVLLAPGTDVEVACFEKQEIAHYWQQVRVQGGACWQRQTTIVSHEVSPEGWGTITDETGSLRVQIPPLGSLDSELLHCSATGTEVLDAHLAPPAHLPMSGLAKQFHIGITTEVRGVRDGSQVGVSGSINKDNDGCYLGRGSDGHLVFGDAQEDPALIAMNHKQAQWALLSRGLLVLLAAAALLHVTGLLLFGPPVIVEHVPPETSGQALFYSLALAAGAVIEMFRRLEKNYRDLRHLALCRPTNIGEALRLPEGALVTLTGTASPSEALRSPYTNEEVLCFRYRGTRHYWQWKKPLYKAGLKPALNRILWGKWSREEDIYHEQVSADSFAVLQDDTGAIAVEVSPVNSCMVNIYRAVSNDTVSDPLSPRPDQYSWKPPTGTHPNVIGDVEEVMGFYAGSTLHVVGQIHHVDGATFVAPCRKGNYMVSTLSREEQVKSKRQQFLHILFGLVPLGVLLLGFVLFFLV